MFGQKYVVPVTHTYAVSDSNRKATERFLFKTNTENKNSSPAVTIWVSNYVISGVYFQKMNLTSDRNGKKSIVLLFTYEGRNMRLCIFPNMEKLQQTRRNRTDIARVISKDSEIMCAENISSDLIEEITSVAAKIIAKMAVS